MGKTKRKINVRYSAEKHMDPPLNLPVAYLRTMLMAFYSRGAVRGLKTRGVKWMFRMKVKQIWSYLFRNKFHSFLASFISYPNC